MIVPGKISRLALLSAAILILPLLIAKEGGGIAREAMIVEIDGAIGSGSATFLARAIESAEQRNSHIIIIRLDTPGGLNVSMKSMVKSILNSRIPVVVYVAPRGASAASAGVLVTVAAHVAAMSPGTNIGAAHPVQSDGSDIQETMETKVLNDMASYGRGIAADRGRNAEWVERAIRESVSITADEAMENNVIDLVATDMDDLLNRLDGRSVRVKDRTVTLDTGSIESSYYSPRMIDRILMLISDPTVMTILFSIGLLGLGFEITHPGAIFPGVIGGISLILAFYSMQTLPVNYAGLLLIAVGLILFLMEIKITSYGLLSLGGVIALALGSMMFFEDLGLNYMTIIPFIVTISGFFIFVGWLAFKAQVSRPKNGANPMIGETGVVKKALAPEGLVYVHGEYWTAVSDTLIPPGENVKIEAVQGLTLKVKKTQ